MYVIWPAILDEAEYMNSLSLKSKIPVSNLGVPEVLLTTIRSLTTPSASTLVSSTYAVSPSRFVSPSPNRNIVGLLTKVTDSTKAANNSPLLICSLSWKLPPTRLITSKWFVPESITVATTSDSCP